MRGFSLVEVLITLFVFSIGLLAIGGLQLISKQSNFESIQRTTATLLAHDIIERMRANPGALDGYVSYSGATTVTGGTLATPAPLCTDTAPCDAFELAAYDLWQWEQAIAGATETTAGGTQTGGLMTPTGCISGPAAGGAGVYTVTIAWQGRSELSDAAKAANACGDGRYGTDDKYRRLLSITTFISP